MPVITKNGITKLSGPPALDLSKYQTDKKITDPEVLRILEQPLSRNTGNKKSKNKNKKKKKATTTTTTTTSTRSKAETSGEDGSDDSDD